MSDWIGLPEDTSQWIGFVYIIKNHHPECEKCYYLGQKKILKRVKRKTLQGKTRNRITYKDNDVQKYWGSSKELLSDIQKYGLDYFSREVIELCDSKFHMTYAELDWQMKCNALMDSKSYNGIINCRLSRIPANFKDCNRDIEKLNLNSIKNPSIITQ